MITIKENQLSAFKSDGTEVPIPYFTNATLDQKENAYNKVISLSSSSTDTEYPSAKCVYDLVGDVESALGALI